MKTEALRLGSDTAAVGDAHAASGISQRMGPPSLIRMACASSPAPYFSIRNSTSSRAFAARTASTA
jgi:hypothetical protein